jgi:hypothetical protein
MTGAEFRRLGSRLLVLIFLLAGLSFIYPGQLSAVARDDCYADCQRISRFCQAHPDGQYENLDGINECSSFVSTTFCYNWDCPHAYTNKFTYSPCLYNPSLPDCDCNINPYGPNCGNPTSTETCPNIVDNCHATCVAAAQQAGKQCCSWTVAESCISCMYTLCN